MKIGSTIITSLLSLVAFPISNAFVAFMIAPTHVENLSTRTSTSLQGSAPHDSDRRSFLAKAASSTIGLMTIGGSMTSLPVFAEVSQGNSLPDGAAQFKRIINLKSDIPLIIKRVSENASEIDKKEWDNLSDFLRRLYKGGDDMKSFAKTSIYDPSKKKQADDDVKLLQKLAQAGDGPVSKQDAEGYALILKKSYDVLENFFELLRDVPDEL
mmetsp:Transcript_3610/g.4762  ORF Transcript_3610/g.4762 Transcript_3610/m.4762 type:complete len:212 (-) Transcript_3610:141-776(-)